MTSLLLALLLAQAVPPKTHSRPGTTAPYVINVQGHASGTPIPVSGSFSAAGAADTVGGAVTFDSNSDCGFVATAGQVGAGFILQSGTLAATLTPSVSVDSTNGTNGTWVATTFVDIDGNTASTLVVTNPNAATVRGLKMMSGVRYARVCTTSFTSGSTTGNLVATTPEPPPPAAGADVTDRAGRLLGVISAGTNNIGDVDVLSIAAGNNNIGDVDVASLPATPAGDNDIGNVDLEFAGTAAATGNGTVSAQTQRVTIASDSTGQVAVASIAAGDNNVGNVDVASIAAGDADIGNVDLEFAGTAAATGNGTVSAQTQRVTIASDSTGQVAVASIAAGDNNVGNVDIVTFPNEGQQTAANSVSVTPDTDNDSIGATGAAVPGEATLIAGTDGTNVTVPFIDPCAREAKSWHYVDMVTATTVEIANAVASERWYICSIHLVSAGANNVAILEDDTDGCGSPSAGVSTGGTTAGEGWNLAANGGIAFGDGSASIMKSTTDNRYLCIITSAAVQLSGSISYVSAPP